jgi:DNA invertase Pin-like site-specific DNA recombinase
MAIYGFIRCSLLKGERSPEDQIAMFAQKAKELGASLSQTFVEPGNSGKKTTVLESAAGKEMLKTIQAGDTLIVTRLDRLGYSTQDVQQSLATLCGRDVRIHVLQALDGDLDLAPERGKTLLQLFALLRATERALRSERATESVRGRKGRGLAHGQLPMARKVVEINGVKVLEWDLEQLEIIAQVAERIAREPVEEIAADFWSRGVKDRHGRLWGKQTPKPNSRYRTPYQQFHRTARWFHRMKRKGLLPPPYDTLALLMEEPKGFREEPKPKKWTRGGTARREREQAETKTRNQAKRLACWKREKERRLEKRAHTWAKRQARKRTKTVSE